MSVVAVAGGTGEFGQLIVQALLSTGRHQVYILSRTAKNYDNTAATVIPASYDSVPALTELLTSHGVNVVICAFSQHAQSTSDAQVNLIRAADRAPCTRRFLPSEFNVDYDLPDSLLPYADKCFHRDARRALEQDTSTLEFAYIYTGMFMDYFGIPNIDTHLRELPLLIDPRSRRALLPGDGTAPLSLNELVRIAGKHVGAAMQISYQGMEQLLRHENAMLPRAEALAEEFPQRFPRGREQVRSLIADLEVSVALGAFDLDVMAGSDTMDLTAHFHDVTEPPMTIEQLMETAWGSI